MYVVVIISTETIVHHFLLVSFQYPSQSKVLVLQRREQLIFECKLLVGAALRKWTCKHWVRPLVVLILHFDAKVCRDCVLTCDLAWWRVTAFAKPRAVRMD